MLGVVAVVALLALAYDYSSRQSDDVMMQVCSKHFLSIPRF
jgi:septal ring factor EnvC (AmiA/AmiB activator)